LILKLKNKELGTDKDETSIKRGNGFSARQGKTIKRGNGFSARQGKTPKYRFKFF
jgi:hypothetical protein